MGLTITEIQVVTIHLVPGFVSFTSSSSQLAATLDEWNYSGDYQFNQTFAKEMVDLHNYKRLLHHSQPLRWNFTLFEYAQAFANKYDCSGNLRHSGGVYGENLALGYTPKGAISAWYSEGDTYDYEKHNTYDHFTAMIWNSTTQIGCGLRYCNPVWSNYIICSYYPAGNVVGYSENNVFAI